MKIYKSYYITYIFMTLIMFFGGSLVWLAQNDTFVSSLEPLTDGKTIFTVIGIALLIATTTISLTQLLDDGVTKYYSVDKVPARRFSLVKYKNLTVLQLENFAWTIEPYRVRIYEKKLHTNATIKVTSFYDKKQVQKSIKLLGI